MAETMRGSGRLPLPRSLLLNRALSPQPVRLYVHELRRRSEKAIFTTASKASEAAAFLAVLQGGLVALHFVKRFRHARWLNMLRSYMVTNNLVREGHEGPKIVLKLVLDIYFGFTPQLSER